MKRFLDWISSVFTNSGNDEEKIKNIIKLENEVKTMQEQNKELVSEIDEKNQKLRSFELVSAAINAKPIENQFLKEFGTLLKEDFKDKLCETVKNVNDAQAMEKMNLIFREMQLIALCPELYSKSIGAIGGGFSSGKSSFINSFLDSTEIKLAEGINPVTVIPSYVICDKNSRINGVSFKNGSFEISRDIYNSLSHEYVKKTFSFDLNSIIYYTSVQTSMKKEYFKNLCLIDTPGYNPPDSGNTKHDFENAQQYIKEAEFLIWMVGLDVNGTIPKSDIEFLRKLDMFGIKPELPLYIVANKPQLRKGGDIKDILNNFADTLDDNDIYYSGISAYDTKTKKLYAHRGKQDLFEFLAEHNKPSQRYMELKTILHDVFKEYVEKIKLEYNEKEENRKKVKSIMLDAIEGGNVSIDDDASSKMEEGLNDLLHYFQSGEEYKKNIEMVNNIRRKFIICLRNFCDAMGIKWEDERICEMCGVVLKNNGKICSKCSSGTGVIKKSETIKKSITVNKKRKELNYQERRQAVYEMTPQNNCGKCGNKNCMQFAMQAASLNNRNVELTDCPYIDNDEAIKFCNDIDWV